MSTRSSAQIEVVIGINVKAARESLGWKQAELAERSGGISRSTVAKIECGGPVTASTLSDIADAFGIPPFMLMLRTADWKKLANVATCQLKIEEFISSSRAGVSPEKVERIQEMSGSSLKEERRSAVIETNEVVRIVFGLGTPSSDADGRSAETSKVAGTGIATRSIPTYPVINGLIANLIAS